MSAEFHLPPAQRRQALAWGHANAALWAAGNGLTTGPLVSYLARDLGAQGLALSLVLAAPSLAGVLRLLAPAVIDQAGTARRACLRLFLASYLLLAGVPLVAFLSPLVERAAGVALMIGLLFFHQLLEYLATVALWSWWGDLVPAPIRGRYFARRQRIQLAITIPTLLASGYFADFWRERFQSQPAQLLLAYVIPTAIGAGLLLGSLLPLVKMPATRRYPRPNSRLVWRSIAAPFADRRFWPVLVFRGWFSLANGISQTVQNVIYPKEILGFGVGPLSLLRVTTQVGQLAASRRVGQWSDRFGNRPVLIAAQICVSLALVFYLAATGPQTRWLLLGAWVLFSAYVAHNICLPNLVLKLAPDAERPAYIASGEALGSMTHALATIAGGLLFDWLRANSANPAWEPYRSCFLVLSAGFVMRSLAVVLLTFIQEPGAWRWRDILLAGRPSPVEASDAPETNPLVER